ncbi:MAG: CHASE2 domain-containing protein, partial [Actinomycetia bacterium]|nr:CHASE2 domain-containing protein [Actinomycetes bacterium]
MLKNKPKLNGVLTGLAITILGVIWFFVVNPQQKMEFLLFDLRMRECNTLQPTTPIIHVDIDDNSLERVGRWPWHRDQLADLIRTLDELDAKVIAVDLLLGDPEAPIVTDPRYTRDADVEPDVNVVGKLSEQNIVFGDLELAEAIRTAGNVYLPAQFEVRSPDEPKTLREELLELYKDDHALTLADAISRLHRKPTPENNANIEKELLRFRMRESLLKEFTLSDQELATKLDTELVKIADIVAGVKTAVARELVGHLFENGEQPSLELVLKSVLGEKQNRHNADRTDMLAAYRANLGLVEVRKASHPIAQDALSGLNLAVSAEPPHFLLAQAARGIASVNFKSDPDGSTRRVPLIVNWEGRIIKHLGFAVACDVLGLDVDKMTIEDRVLTIPTRDGSGVFTVPLDENGNLIIHWTATAQHWRDFKDFPHISAAKVWVLIDARRQIENNNLAISYLYADIIAASKGDVVVSDGSTTESESNIVRADSPFRKKVNTQLELAGRLHLHRLRRDVPPDEIASLQQQLDVMVDEIAHEQQAAAANIEMACSQIAELPAEELEADPDLKRDAKRFLDAGKILNSDVARLVTVNASLSETVESLKQELSKKIRGGYVFLGYAATATGDIVTTPIDPRTNGVMCHAHIFNDFLQDRFITRTARWIDALACLVLGAIVAIVTALRGPRYALLLTLGLMIAYTAFICYYLFMGLQLWSSLAAPIVTMFVTWAIVTLFRQLTAERDRRFFAKQLSQYTSPAIAARIAESPEAAKAFKTVQTREVTCFFSDLKGFTTITEKEDAEVVQHVLNTYLERMCRVIWAERGLINKFMGDGIMAFFNASVDPLEAHAPTACETSVLTIRELERLKEEEREGPYGRIFDQLHMRVGLASGLCKNGDLGSELKADYTVIGDVVNLAARLEPANKVFGTQIMVSGPTMEAVKGRYAFRYLAELQVKGKALTVPVYEIVCREDELTDEQRAYIERFEAGVELYKERKWDECIVHFTRL